MLRICIPLDRVEVNGISDYHGFSTLVGLDVELENETQAPWQTDRIAHGDSSGLLDTRGRGKHPGSGSSTPRRAFSLKSALPFGKSGSGRDSSDRELTPSRHATYIDSALPPCLAPANRGVDETAPHVWPEDWRHQYTFNVAVLNEQAWFAEALQSAVPASSGRKYKSGVKRPKVIMDVAGYDCLATDDEVGAQGGILSRTSTSTSDGEDDDLGFASETLKAEKAALAAKVFGLREDEGIYCE